MTPEAYTRGLKRLEAGTLPERSVASLGAEAAARLVREGMGASFANVIPDYWYEQVEGRRLEVQAERIAKAVLRLRDVLKRSPGWEPYLRLPDATFWNMAGAPIVGNETGTLALSRYLAMLHASLSDEAGKISPTWGGTFAEDHRKSPLLQFVIRYVEASVSKERDLSPDATRGQRRYGRNAEIAAISSAILARRVTRGTVAQTLKKTV